MNESQYNGEFERSLTEKLNRAGNNKEKFLVSKTKARRKLFHDSDSEDSPGRMKKSALSTSAYQTRKGTMSVVGTTLKNDCESVESLIHNLEAKQARASANRINKKEDKLRMIKQKPELNNLIQIKMEREQKDMEDIFSRVTIKRHEKDKKIKKQQAIQHELAEQKKEMLTQKLQDK